MSPRGWIAAIASGLVLVWALTALAQEPEKQGSARELGNPELLSAIKSIESAIREHTPKADKEESKKEQRELADLKAQQEMAIWAERMVWATVAGLVLTFVGLMMIGGTLHYTRQAAIAARNAVVEANNATRIAENTNAMVARNSALELRAYLSVLPAGVNELLGNQRAMGHVEVRNVGRVPAREVWVYVRMRIGDRDDVKPALSKGPDDYEMPDDPYDLPSFKVDRAIQPGTQMRQGAAEDDLIPVRDLLAQQDKYVYVWGIVWYSDGTKRRFTRFRHRYAIASCVHRKDWNKPAHETRAIITVDKARFHPFGNSAN